MFARLGHLFTAAAMLSTPLPALAAPACIPAANARDMVVVLTPSLMTALDKRCVAAGRPGLLSDPALKQMHDRLEAAGEPLLGSAAVAFRGMSGGKLPEGLSDRTVSTMMREALPPHLLADASFKAQNCGRFAVILRSLVPLSAAQIGDLMIGLVGLSGVKDPSICSE